MTRGHVAVIDIGKTNAKLALVRLSDLAEIAVLTRPNTVLPGPPYPHFDVDGHWQFLLDGLSRFHSEHGVSAISVTTHGAAAALIAADGSLAVPILDYEHPGPNDTESAYDALRPPFYQTGSPRLSMGLNLGAQLHWLFEIDPKLRDRVNHIVTYPQYWGYLLTGALATDVTSLGCHTDLWNPYESKFSSLSDALGVTGKIARPQKPGDMLGPLLPEIAEQTGLPPDTQVFCGIHDSNASLLAHLSTRRAPFSVVSTGTWVVALSVGGKPVALAPDLDTLVNVNAFGDAVPSARFMGGREHDLALGETRVEPDETQIRDVLNKRIMLLPSLIPETGPFPGFQARWLGGEPAKATGQRSAAVGFYLALVTARCLDLIGHDGPVIVEGPFARNLPYLRMLQAVMAAPVYAMSGATGTSQGAALLSTEANCAVIETTASGQDDRMLDQMRLYADAWKQNTNTG